jgi:hypothetical protein
MNDITIVLVDKYGELWTLNEVKLKDNVHLWLIFIFNSETEYIHIYTDDIRDSFMYGMGMEVLGEL